MIRGIVLAALIASSPSQEVVSVGQHWCAIQPERYMIDTQDPVVGAEWIVKEVFASRNLLVISVHAHETGAKDYREATVDLSVLEEEIAHGFIIPCGGVPIA